MQAIISWLVANWVQVLVAVITIDQVLIPIFPQVPFLVSLKNFLSGIVGNQAPKP